MVVITIVAILAAMAIPTFGNSAGRNRAVAAGNRVAADLQFAAICARQQAAPRGVNFDNANRGYAMTGISDPDKPAQAYAVDLRQDPYMVSSLTANFGGSSNVLFDGFGSPNSGGSVIVISGPFQVTVSLPADGSPPTVAGP